MISSTDIRYSFEIFSAYGVEYVIIARIGALIVQSELPKLSDGDETDLARIGWKKKSLSDSLVEYELGLFDD